MLESIIHQIVAHGLRLEGDLVIPTGAKAVILFAHGNGSSRHSTRNQYVTEILNKAGFAMLLVDLLTPGEKAAELANRHLPYNNDLLAGRLREVTKWLEQQPQTRNLVIGYFGSNTGAAAAISAAASFRNRNNIAKALVLCGGRLDLVKGKLSTITAPTLLLVRSSDDALVIKINKTPLKELKNDEDRELALIPAAGHLYEESCKMEEEIAKIAAEWFEVYLLRNMNKFENKFVQKKKSFGLILSSILRNKPHIQIKFKDRVAAGQMLAALLGKYESQEKDGAATVTTVIGIARGGVVVADTVARKLSIHDFDIVFSRKLRAPNNSENGIGAIMQDGSVYLDNTLVESMNVSNQYLETEKSDQKKEIDSRMALYRPDIDKEYKIKGRTVILIDDGAATGATIIAAADWIRKHNPKRLIIALPVAPSQVKMALKQHADTLEIICAASNFTSVEQFYQSFDVVSDQEIIKLLEQYKMRLHRI